MFLQEHRASFGLQNKTYPHLSIYFSLDIINRDLSRFLFFLFPKTKK